jgi:16S rRNA processing protein RimM
VNKEDCILLGTLSKTHGISGCLVLITRIKEYTLKNTWESVFLDIDGILVPFFILSYEQGARDELIICLDDITSREQAAKFKGIDLYIQKKDITIEQQVIDPLALAGYLIIDKQFGNIGRIKEIIRIPQNDLAVIDYNDIEIQLPIQKDLIDKVDHKRKILHMILPDGLLDI